MLLLDQLEQKSLGTSPRNFRLLVEFFNLYLSECLGLNHVVELGSKTRLLLSQVKVNSQVLNEGFSRLQVANVRFNVAKTLKIVGPKLNSGVMLSQVKPCITKLNEDTDFDVRFFASEAAVGKSTFSLAMALVTDSLPKPNFLFLGI